MGIQGLDLNKVSAGAGNKGKPGGGGGDGLIDRSKVKILLCDNNTKSSEEVLTLLLGCSYQVISVKSARQVIDALNAEGQDIDMILAEVDLPMKKGMKMLKYIAQDKDLHRIPVIMMSAQDEVSIVVKCLRLGAADYLVKPLRINELLNLWTHMWRRRHMLGLAEKNILNCDFDLVASDPSDANTNSTTLFSDDTEDKLRRSTNPETGMSIQQEHESTAVADAHEEPQDAYASEHRPDVPGISDRRTGHIASGPKMSELRIGESSAFFSYIKSTAKMSNSQGIAQVDKSAATHLRIEGMHEACAQPGIYNLQTHKNGETYESPSQDDVPSGGSIPDSLSIERSSTPPASIEILKQKHLKEEHLPHGVIHPRNGTHGSESEISSRPTQNSYPYYIPGIVNHVLMPSSSQLYMKNLQDLQNHASTTMIAQYSNMSKFPPHATGITSFPYYTVNMCLQPGQMSRAHVQPSLEISNSSEVKLNKIDRREAALMKFRKKRKERCFDKKIRYVNRKRLAERRPRVRGQFVRKMNGIDVDLNGQPASIDYDDENEEDEEDHIVRDFSPEDA